MFRLVLFIVSFLQAAHLHGHGSCHAFLVSVAEDQDLEVIANPHGGSGACSTTNSGSSSGMLLDKLLEPYQLIVTPMVTQPDTFQDLSYTKVLTVPVPVYQMKQPARISAAELEFRIILVKELGNAGGGGNGDSSGIQEVPYPMEQAMDSWFPGYYWTPLVMTCNTASSESSWQHVGWKFTAVPERYQQHDGINNKQNLPHFYALMVQLDETKTKEGVRVGGFKAPGWMVGAVLNTI